MDLFFIFQITGGFMKKLLAILSTSLLIISLSACENMRGRDVGTVVGAGTGALVGSQFGHGAGAVAATAGGAIVGGVIGHEVGRSMEEEY